MLARNYEYDPNYGYGYTWEEQQAHREEEEAKLREKQLKAKRRMQRRQALVVLFTSLLFYAIHVWVGSQMYNAGQSLVHMRTQEEHLITTTNALKIEVEQLKGPERIRGLASQMLGMRVARENFYVNQVGVKNANTGLAMADN